MRHATARKDAGITLMELVVAMSLSSLIGAMALSAFIVMHDATGTTIDRDIATAGARNVVEQWTALLQLADSPTAAGATADRITSISPTEMVFYADIDNRSGSAARSCPTLLDLSLSGGELIEARTPYTGSACTQPGTTSTSHLLADVSTSGWLFTGYDSNSTAVYTAPWSSVVRVDMTFQVATAANTATRSYTSTAALPEGTS